MRRLSSRPKRRNLYLIGCGGLLLLAVVCGALQSAGRAVGLLPTTTPPPPTATAGPTFTPEPTGTPEPKRTAVPTRTPEPSPTPDPARTATAEARAAAAAAPCEPGQIKANRNSGVYHSPGGQFYAETRDNVQCFASIVEAEAAGFRASER